MTIFHFVYSFREKRHIVHKQKKNKQKRNKTYIFADYNEIFLEDRGFMKSVHYTVLGLQRQTGLLFLLLFFFFCLFFFFNISKIWGGFVKPNKVGESISTKNKHDNNRFSRTKILFLHELYNFTPSSFCTCIFVRASPSREFLAKIVHRKIPLIPQIYNFHGRSLLCCVVFPYPCIRKFGIKKVD